MFNFTIHFKAGDKTAQIDVVAQDEDSAVLLARLGPVEIEQVVLVGPFLAAETRQPARDYSCDWGQSLPPPPPGIFGW